MTAFPSRLVAAAAILITVGYLMLSIQDSSQESFDAIVDRAALRTAQPSTTASKPVLVGPQPWHVFFSGSSLHPCAKPPPPRTEVDQATPLIAMALAALGGQCGGTFIEIGANDGVTISNSYYLETQMEWRGACIEPLPKSFVKMREARPLCYALNAAGSSKPGHAPLKFLQVEGYAEMLSSFVDGMDEGTKRSIDENIAAHGGSKSEIDVATTTLAEVILDHPDVASCAQSTIHFLSLDVESRELDVLKGINFTRMLFFIMICEAHGQVIRQSLVDFMAQQGYIEQVPTQHDTTIDNNIVFVPLPATVAAHAEAAKECPRPLLT